MSRRVGDYRCLWLTLPTAPHDGPQRERNRMGLTLRKLKLPQTARYGDSSPLGHEAGRRARFEPYNVNLPQWHSKCRIGCDGGVARDRPRHFTPTVRNGGILRNDRDSMAADESSVRNPMEERFKINTDAAWRPKTTT